MSRYQKPKSGWVGPVPQEILDCGDVFVTKRFKELVRRADEVVKMMPGQHRKRSEDELNRSLEDLLRHARGKIDEQQKTNRD